ncbi:hypothetical protein AK812_SmicGene4744 [Symbiodinium microadriaticum]|uniref:Uncharacterized protein n=1 Tax=Symbiodinium microadriaticum TaxID=2951 RepID=A0A1Q9EVE6_SYMMI|nr:hypothetical protein AK812_SmicGene4744 [Symbiodinium microadriaticum]
MARSQLETGSTFPAGPESAKGTGMPAMVLSAGRLELAGAKRTVQGAPGKEEGRCKQACDVGVWEEG